MIRLLYLFLLCSCGNLAPDAGQSAAAQMGVPFYISFVRHSQPDSAALFYWRGNWWLYHPSIGSERTVFDDPTTIPKVAVLVIDGASGPIRLKPTGLADVAPLPNGCLPRAISQAERLGGGIAISPHHATFVP